MLYVFSTKGQLLLLDLKKKQSFRFMNRHEPNHAIRSPKAILVVLPSRHGLDFHLPGGMVRTETYLRSQSGNGLLVDQSSPIKNL